MKKAMFDEQGFLVLPRLFTQSETSRLSAYSEAISRQTGAVFETDGVTVRAFHGFGDAQSPLHRLCASPRLLGLAEELLGGSVYVYQFKVNYKAAFNGDVWPWHSDFPFWNLEDGMPLARAITFGLLLDDVGEFNAPLCVIPKSHHVEDQEIESNDGEGWQSHVAAKLKYAVPNRVVERLVRLHGITPLKGAAGSVVVFHSRTIHASSTNLSPFPRKIIFITYNRVDNAPSFSKYRRPDFLVNKDSSPLKMLEVDDIFCDA